jgi:hypothetical protein
MHGGRRPGSGRKAAWVRGKTTVIRVPEVLSEEVLRVAHLLDEGKAVDDVTKSRYLDLSKVPIRYWDGEPVVSVRDLLRVGFKIRPLELIDRLRKELDRRF